MLLFKDLVEKNSIDKLLKVFNVVGRKDPHKFFTKSYFEFLLQSTAEKGHVVGHNAVAALSLEWLSASEHEALLAAWPTPSAPAPADEEAASS